MTDWCTIGAHWSMSALMFKTSMIFRPSHIYWAKLQGLSATTATLIISSSISVSTGGFVVINVLVQASGVSMQTVSILSYIIVARLDVQICCSQHTSSSRIRVQHKQCSIELSSTNAASLLLAIQPCILVNFLPYRNCMR